MNHGYDDDGASLTSCYDHPPSFPRLTVKALGSLPITKQRQKTQDTDDADEYDYPQQQQAGPSSLLSQLLGGGFGGFHQQRPPSYVQASLPSAA